MSEITKGNSITLAAIAERWQISEAEAEKTIRAIPYLPDPDGRDCVEHWLHDGTPLWEAGHVETLEEAFPEFERGEASVVVERMTRLWDAFDDLGVDPGDLRFDLVHNIAEKKRTAKAVA